MTKRLCIALAILVAAVLSVVVWNGSRPAEPAYEGKPLSQWLEGHVPTSAANPPYGSPGWHKAEEALIRTGTNAIPTLLEMIRAKDPPRVLWKLLEFARRQGWMRTPYWNAFQRHEEAEYAFRVLGTNAASAVPHLIKIYEASVSPSSKRCAALALGHIGHPAEAVIPVLLRDFSHSDGQIRFYAVSAVYGIGGDPSVVVPAFRRAVKDTKPEVRWNAVVGLSRFGGRARSAVPELLEALHDPAMLGDDSFKEQVEIALWRIAPEKAGVPLVVEEPSPISAEGVTVEPLDVSFGGQRRTVIPAGTKVPSVIQLWDSEPRSPISLYRGKSGETGTETFLGRFEVMGVTPPPDQANVSVLCVIVEKKIVLCARDNNNEVFLEVRRLE